MARLLNITLASIGASAALAALVAVTGAFAQDTSATQPPAAPPSPPPAASGAPPGGATSVAYKPPLRGQPGGRTGGAVRGMVRAAEPLPTLDLIAPVDHTGETAEASPAVYFFASGPVRWKTQFTISAPLQPVPVVEVTIPSPPAAGLYRVRLSDYRVQLDPRIVYTWSVSVILDPQDWSRNVVASATIMRTDNAGPVTAAQAAGPIARPAILAQAGLWYDAIAAAAAPDDRDGHAALDSLFDQEHLGGPARFDRVAERQGDPLPKPQQ
jgi:hypothetical protein